MKNNLLFFAILLLLSTLSLRVYPGNFTDISPSDSLFVTSDTTDFWVVAAASADYDNDGDLDIAVLGYFVTYFVGVEQRFILMRNDSLNANGSWNFTYIDVPLDSLIAGSSDLSWGDVDADGDLDLALGTNGVTLIYRNDDGNLVMTDTQLPGYWEDNFDGYFNLHSISWADYDNDGDLDLLIPSVFDFNSFSYKTSLMQNEGPDGNGGWIFNEVDSVFAPTQHAQSYWADYDQDGDLDLLLLNIAPFYEEGFIRRYTNNGNGNFTSEDLFGPLSIEHGEAQWGDYDGDGDLDVLVAGNLKETDGNFTPMSLRIYQNTNEVYSPIEVIPDPASAGWFDFTAATWADYDSDGDIDILLAGNYNSGEQIEGRARILTNDNGIFTDSGLELPAPHASGDRAGTFSWLDLDMDGDLDYFIAGEYFVPGGNGLVEAQMHIYQNDASMQNLAPLAPSGLNVSQLGDNIVKLTWLPGSDDHTPAAALTYNLELYRDNVPVSLPEQDPEPGNVSNATEWSFSALLQGEYSWIVRTVDASFSGSPAAAGSFAVGPTGITDTRHVTGYSLYQNFPNPTNGLTTIMYSIPQAGRVSLKLYNINGAEVLNLVEEYQKTGDYSYTFNAADLPDGIYNYRLISGNFLQTKKFIISK